jgi:hypothetical protein
LGKGSLWIEAVTVARLNVRSQAEVSLRPMRDYPAAHSMDSTWFAVDANGELAFFDTGEGGCLPEGGFPAGGEAGGRKKNALEDTQLLAYALLARAQRDDRLRSMLPNDAEKLAALIDESQDAWEFMTPLLRSLGVWTYSCDDSVATPYLREGLAIEPLRIGEFAEPLQRRFDSAQLPIRFSEMPAIAPGEFVGVTAWSPLWFDLKGQPHPTIDQGDEFEEHVADIGSWQIEAEAREGNTLQGEDFYEAIRDLLTDSESKLKASPNERVGFLSRLRRFFGGG